MAITKTDNQKPDGTPHTVSCGCCTQGCVCSLHRYLNRGIAVHTCDYHQTVKHPRITSRSGWPTTN